MSLAPLDRDLIEQARAADHQALTAIYERYAPAIYRYILRRVGDAEQARDVQSEVFIRMLEGIGRYEQRGWPIQAWLYRIAHDRTVDALRERRRRPQLPLYEDDVVTDGPDQICEERLEYAHVQRSLGQLSAAHQEVLRLRFSEDLSVQEVAARMGRSEGAVKALQYRGLRALGRLVTPPAELADGAAPPTPGHRAGLIHREPGPEPARRQRARRA